MTILLLEALLMAGAWSREFPAVPKGAMAYEGRYGKHATFRGQSAPPIDVAIRVCGAHAWTGYVRWRSNDGSTNVDACVFLKAATGSKG